MDRVEHLDVFYHEKKVGTLALYQKHLVAFAYEQEWLDTGFPISPFSLPLEKKVFVPRVDPFDGLFGVNPGIEDILAVAEQIGIGRAQAGKIAREVRDCVKEMLGVYLI